MIASPNKIQCLVLFLFTLASHSATASTQISCPEGYRLQEESRGEASYYRCESAGGSELQTIEINNEDLGRALAYCDFGVVANGEGRLLCRTQSNAPEPPERGLVSNEFVEVQQKCIKAQEVAMDCCQNPLKCVSGIDLGAAGSGALQALLSGGSALALSQGGQIKQACQTMKVMGYVGAGLNGAVAYRCHSRKNSCLDVCEKAYKWHKEALQLTSPLDPKYEALHQAKLELAGRVSRCEGYSQNVNQLTQQAIHDGFAAKMSELCEKQAVATTESSSTIDELAKAPSFPQDCSEPANKENPLCQDVCDKEGAENNPLCRNQVPGVEKEASDLALSDYNKEAASNSALDEFNVAESGLSEGVVKNLGDDVPVEKPDNKGVPQGGGGFSGSSSGGGLPPLSEAVSNEVGAGAKTDILKGLASGNGYSVSHGSFADTGGGFSGYGPSDNDEAKGRDLSAFDLDKYLPGSSKPKGRRLAGGQLNRHPEVASPHESIWKRMSNRYQVICKLGRLMDCQKSQ